MSTQDQPFLAHQFDDLGQQKEADTLGMWAFLSTELMFFGGLFTAFTIYRIAYTEAFAQCAQKLSMTLGGINTGVLLCSSLTVALAVWAAHRGNMRLVCWLLLATIALGLIFIGIKFTEYYFDWQESIIPGFRWNEQKIIHEMHLDPARLRLFMTFYFVMTSIHALHMVIGIGIFAVVAYKSWTGRYAPEYYNPIEISGLYWHFVDIIWIFLFPTLYLLH